MILGDVIPRNAALRGGQAAVVHDGGTLGFAGLAERAYRLANALIARGVARQDRISLLAQNCVEYVEVLGAGETTGIIVHPVNFRLTAPEVAYVLGDAAPSVVFFEAQYAALMGEIRASLSGVRAFVQIGGDGVPGWAEPYEALLAAGAPLRPALRPHADDTAFIFYSSGSTGRPKGVMLGQRAQWNTALIVGYETGITPRDTGLIVMPLFHIGGRFFQIAHHMAGATIHLPRRFDAAAVADTIERERITTLHLAPTMVQALLDVPGLDQRDISSLRTLSYGASAMPVALLRRALARFGPILIQRYGSTEAAVVSALDKHQHVPDGTPEQVARLASAGQAGAMAEICVRHADGSECAPGESGSIWVRNPDLVMQGYWRNPDATAAVLRDGWYEMGDVGYLDAEGFLFIVDRKTEMIVSGGENIYPREVEEALMHHPAVMDTAVIGIPDEKWGESVLAFVVLRDGMSAGEDEIVAFCRTRIASYKKPRRVEFRDRLPRASTGKIDKIALREPYWKGRDRRV
jgi:acyl-CoA synthetase (AMP-forming)/AMP-acid ligase II